MRAYAEYGLHEFGAFEYGLESIALPSPADLSSQGGVLLDILTIANANSLVGIAAKGVGTFVGTAFNYSRAFAAGHASVSPRLLRVQHGKFTAVARAELDPLTGYAAGITFSSNSESAVEFFLFEGNEFRIRASSSVVVNMAATAWVDTYINGHTEFIPSNYAFYNTEAEALGAKSEFDGFAQAFTHARYFGSSAATVIPRVLTVKVNRFVATASGLLVPQGQTVTNRIFSAKGASTGLFPLAYKRFVASQAKAEGQVSLQVDSTFTQFLATLATIQGASYVDAAGQRILSGVFKMDAQTYAAFNRGRHVFPSLPSAYETIMRPYEDRMIIWKDPALVTKY